jgi:hypothetical protein
MAISRRGEAAVNGEGRIWDTNERADSPRNRLFMLRYGKIYDKVYITPELITAG